MSANSSSVNEYYWTMTLSGAYQITFWTEILYLDSKFHFLEKLPSNENLKKIVFALFLLYVTVKLIKYLRARKLSKKLIADKVSQVEKNKEELETKFGDGKLVDGNWWILDESFEELLQKLQNGSLGCLEVLHAYQAKALEITNELNCVTEFIKEAEEWAAKLDGISPSQRGPLHGLPFSIKDNVAIIGYDSTAGLTRNLFKPKQEDAAIVSALKSLGAVPFCKTNIPQSMLSFGCGNPIWGMTKNPFCKDRTPGGSSGGEACLVAAGGATFGIGSDIGGSVRVPASFCGISSIKPTSRRMSYKGFHISSKVVGIDAVPGIVAKDTSTVILISKLLLQQDCLQTFDDSMLPIPWNEQLSQPGRKLKIGYYEDDGFFPTTPGVQRAVRMAREHYEKLGHELIPFRPFNVEALVKSYGFMMVADQAETLLTNLSVDDIDPSLKYLMWMVKTPHFLKRLFSPLLSFFSPRSLPMVLGSGGRGGKLSSQLWKLVSEKDDYKQEFISKWRSSGLDLCIGPTYACPAPLSKDIGRLYSAGSYTILYNYLDLPVGIVPVTRENEEDQRKLADYNTFDVLVKLAKQTTTGAHGLPIGVQIIGLPYQEELIFHGMDILSSIAKA